MNCPICKSKKVKPLKYNNTHSHICKKCDCIFTIFKEPNNEEGYKI